jgi:hypothetical protein
MAASARAVSQRDYRRSARVARVITVRIILTLTGKFNIASAKGLMSLLLMKPDATVGFIRNTGTNDQEFCVGHASLIFIPP